MHIFICIMPDVAKLTADLFLELSRYQIRRYLKCSNPPSSCRQLLIANYLVFKPFWHCVTVDVKNLRQSLHAHRLRPFNIVNIVAYTFFHSTSLVRIKYFSRKYCLVCIVRFFINNVTEQHTTSSEKIQMQVTQRSSLCTF